MILTVFVFIFIFRIRYSVIERFELSSKQCFVINIFFFLNNILFFGIVFVFNLSSLQFFTPVLIFALEIVALKLLEMKNLEVLLLETENMLTKLSIDLKNAKSFYSSVKSYCSDTESFRQQKHRNMILSVLFAQQKSVVYEKSKAFSDFLNVINTIQENTHSASNILECFRRNFLNRKKISLKKKAITQNVRAQTLICSFLFVGLIIFQLNFNEFVFLFPFLLGAVTFFVIGILGIIFFMRFYI